MLGIKIWGDLNSIFIEKNTPKKWREWLRGFGRAENNICGNQESRRNRELCSCDNEPVIQKLFGGSTQQINPWCLFGIIRHHGPHEIMPSLGEPQSGNIFLSDDGG